MIRVNLLPQKKRAEAARASQLWLVVLLVTMIAEVAALFVFHGIKGEELTEQKKKNDALNAQISKSRSAVSDHQRVKEQLAELRSREAAIDKLQVARTGPTAMLLELSRLLTSGRGPTVDPEELNKVRRENPQAAYNPSWDARRLWLTKFVEDNRQVRLEGIARDGEDVSEFAKRMTMSSYFYDVRLLPAKKQHDSASGLDVVNFQLEAKVRY
ncbi:MAG: PilN domain-containing protein [Sorangiineae bacterium]|nr:PilN domain-containing protein [Polyangiaceae bacterium]MEB2323591.1 PilN domain-containing protein [Sorangiineae bacterium]